MKRNKWTGQFEPTPAGEKTAKMLEVERRLGRTIEEDFAEYYVKKKYGQKRLVQRWGVPRNIVFSMSMRGGRRCWVQMLGLPVRRSGTQDSEPPHSLPPEECEICGADDLPLDGAHWVPVSSRGSNQSYNILRLCPNCHRRLDTGDQNTERAARSALLYRETCKLLDAPLSDSAKKTKLVELASAIMQRKPVGE